MHINRILMRTVHHKHVHLVGLLKGVMMIRSSPLNTAHVTTYLKSQSKFVYKMSEGYHLILVILMKIRNL